MSNRLDSLGQDITSHFGDRIARVENGCGELSFEVAPASLIDVATGLRDETAFGFDMLIDLCAVDYSEYASEEWKTRRATSTGFSRGVNRAAAGNGAGRRDVAAADERRFAVVYHLLSVTNNQRLRLRVYAGPGEPPIVPSVVDLWPSANWYEREAFDLFGILFDGHPDLRRLLTDYGFVGHPFRKDFPLIGNVEVRYDEEKKRVVYQPVSIEPRTLVPRVIRDDHRYEPALKDGGDHG
jgi:NADH-quinone oxidoreductase subunit C